MLNEMKKRIYLYLSIALTVLFSLILAIVVYQVNPYLSGDGREYVLQSEAWTNHFSIDIREEDAVSGMVNFPTVADTLKTAYKDKYGMKDGLSGRLYANHFAGYSLLVLPVKLILKSLNANQLAAFQITNAALYIAALFCVICFLKAEWSHKFYILLLLCLNPALTYITWTHTEIFIFSMVIIGLVFAYNKQYHLSILFVSLGIMQNLALMPLGVAIGIDCLIQLYHSEMKKYEGDRSESFLGKYSILLFIRSNIWRIVGLGTMYIPAFLPIIIALFEFHTVSIVATVAQQSMYLGEKALAYLFDLNLGIFPYAPLVLLLYFVMVTFGFKKVSYNTILNLLTVGGIIFIVSNQLQINSGMSGMMRYNVWILPIMIFFVVMNKDLVFNRRKWVINLLLLLSAIVSMSVFLLGGMFLGTNVGSSQLTPWAKWVMTNYPQIYNPYHPIFISRVTGSEKYDSNIPVIFVTHEGLARKILLNPNSLLLIREFGFEGKESDIKWLHNEFSLAETRQGYYYINVPIEREILIVETCKRIVHTEIDTSSVSSEFYGWEGDHRWIKPYQKFAIKKEQLISSGGFEIEYATSDLIARYNPGVTQTIEVILNGQTKVMFPISLTEKRFKYSIPASAFPKTDRDFYWVELVSNIYFNPQKNGYPLDNRNLSFLLYYFGPIRDNGKISGQILYAASTAIDEFYGWEGDRFWAKPYQKFTINRNLLELSGGFELEYATSNVVVDYNVGVSQELKMIINGKVAIIMPAMPTEKRQEFFVPYNNFPKGNENELLIELVSNISINPQELGISNDNRNLSYSVYYFGPMR